MCVTVKSLVFISSNKLVGFTYFLNKGPFLMLFVCSLTEGAKRLTLQKFQSPVFATISKYCSPLKMKINGSH